MKRVKLNSIIAGLIFITVFSCGDVVYSSSLQLKTEVFLYAESKAVSFVCSSQKDEESCFELLKFSLFNNKEFFNHCSNNQKIKEDLIEHSNLSRAPPL